MAELDQKLHVKNGSTVQEVTLYTTPEEATPTGGSYGEITFNGTICYFALWDKSIPGGDNHTPVTVKKNNIEYWLDCSVVSVPILTLTLPATINQTITLIYTEPDAAESITITSTNAARSIAVPYGTTWTASVTADIGYSAGTLSAASGTIEDSTTISITQAVLQTFTLTLPATTNQIITLTYDEPNEAAQIITSTNSSQTITVSYGTYWTATVVANAGYNTGTLSPGSTGTVTDNVSITITAATIQIFSLNLVPTQNQTITLTYIRTDQVVRTVLSSDIVQSIDVEYGTTWTAYVTPNAGYDAGALSPGASGTVTDNTIISATEATGQMFTLTLSTVAHQIITLTYTEPNESAQTIASTNTDQYISVPYGTTWTAIVSPDTGYDAGALSPGSSGTVTANVIISAAVATLQTFTLTLAATENQTITINYVEPDETENTVTSTNNAQEFTVHYGTTWTATIVADAGYNVGTLSSSSGTITNNVTITASQAIIKTFTLSLAATENQTITLVYTEPGQSAQTVTSNSTTQSFTVKYGTAWTASATADTGYNAGALSLGSSGTVTGNTTITIEQATLQTFTLTLIATEHLTVTLTYTEPDNTVQIVTLKNGSQDITVPYGTTWTASSVGDTGYTDGVLTPGISGTITGNVTVTASGEELQTFNLSVYTSDLHQTVTLTYTEPGESAQTVTFARTFTSEEGSVIVHYGTTWTASVSADYGYIAGALTPGSSGTVTDDTTISVAQTTFQSYTLTLAATENQTISLTYTEPDNNTYTINSTNAAQIITVPYTTTWTATITADSGYDAGTLSPGTFGIIYDNTTTISATQAVLQTFILTLNAVDRYQTVTLTYTEPNSTAQTITSTTSVQSVTVGYGTTWTATSVASAGYDAGTLTPGSSGTVTSNTVITAAPAIRRTYTLTLAATENQTITLVYTDPNEEFRTLTLPATEHQTITVDYTEPTVTATSTSTSQAITLPYGTKWTASIEPDTGYNPGTLSTSSGTVTGNVTISASAVTLKDFTLTLSATENQTITLTYTEPNQSAQTITSANYAKELTLSYGTTWTASITAASGYSAGTLSAASGTVTGNTTISTTAAIMYTNLNRYYENIPNYSSITSLPQNVIDALTNIIVGPDASYAYVGCALLTSIPCTNTWDTSNVVNMEELISHLPKVTSIDLSTFNTSNVTNMNGMFNDCKSLVSLNLSNFNTSNVTEMNAMFADGFPLTSLDISSFNFSKVTTLFRFFNGASKLQTIIWPSTIDTSQITNMSRMFDGCTSLTTIPQLDTSKATNMSSMFYNCRSLTTIPQLDTSKATSMTKMFEGCTSLTTIPQLDTSKATEMRSMFYNCSSLPSTFPWVINCSSIIDSGRLTSMFGSSSVTSVTLRNVNSSIRSQITSQLLKGNDTLTIIFV